MIHRPGNDAAPEGHVGNDLRLGDRSALLFEGGGIHGGGDRVEGHVDDGGRAPGQGGPGGGGEALPLGSARLVDVDMGIDEAGEDDQVPEVDVGGAVAQLDDGSLLDADRGGPDTLREGPPGWI
jgi:hypothetical protein